MYNFLSFMIPKAKEFSTANLLKIHNCTSQNISVNVEPLGQLETWGSIISHQKNPRSILAIEASRTKHDNMTSGFIAP
jgi:hypothetical protein